MISSCLLPHVRLIRTSWYTTWRRPLTVRWSWQNTWRATEKRMRSCSEKNKGFVCDHCGSGTSMQIQPNIANRKSPFRFPFTKLTMTYIRMFLNQRNILNGRCFLYVPCITCQLSSKCVLSFEILHIFFNIVMCISSATESNGGSEPSGAAAFSGL